jgi:AcrR family transcriptional regulator
VAAVPAAPTRTRAKALSPEERRAEIVAATLPLVLTHGANVTTRQIAEAAGIAEGTIFRVFPDKESLLAAVFESALDPTATDVALAAIDPSLPLERRLVAAVDILHRRVADLWQLRTALGMLQGEPPAQHKAPDLTSLATLFEADRDAIRRDPLEAAHVLRALTIATTHPALILDEPLTSEEIVTLFLDGIRARPDDRKERS